VSSSFFPSKVMAWYVAKLFLVRTFAVLFALVIVLQALDLLGESGKILAQPGNGQGEILTYVSLRAPQIIARFLPFSVLLSTIITLATLNQNSEVVSMKAAGLSAHQVLAPLIITSIAVAAISFAFNDRIVSRAASTLVRWQKSEYAEWPKAKGAFEDVWVRDGDNLVNVGAVTGRAANMQLTDITVYNRDGGVLNTVLRADGATRVGKEWVLKGARRFEVATGVSQLAPEAKLGQGIRPDQLTLSAVDPDGMSFGALWRVINDLNDAGRPTRALTAVLWHKISGPLSTLLMPLLGAVAAFGIARSGKLFVRAVIGMALGFAYFIADNFGLAMGNLGAYPPLLAAWGPFFLFLLIGEFVLIKTEE
jgi:lipopolysaccharide export system permease protein